MKLTEFFRLRMPDGTDPVNIEDFNDNFEVIDRELKKRISDDGSASDVTVGFEVAESRQPLKSGEKLSVLMGKVHRFFTDLKTVAFSGKYGDLSERPSLGGASTLGVANNCTTTEAGFALDARQGKTLMDKSNELSRDLGGLEFAQDATGNWGYKIGGADPVIPFKTEPFVYDFSDGTFNLSDSSKPYYVKDYKKLTKQNFHGSCSWSCYEYFHHTDTADHEHRNSGGISFTYSPDTGTLIVKRNQTNGFITLVC